MRRRRWAVGLLLATLATLAAASVLLGLASQAEVPPRRLADYLDKRARGHDNLAGDAVRLLARGLTRFDRGMQVLPLRPPWRVGVQAAGAAAPPGRAVLAIDAQQLRQAMAQALPGDVITLAPGRYRVDGQPLEAGRAGRADAPITVRGPQPGAATLEFDLVEGFRVTAPYWRVENLVIRGVCAEHSACEHAFHVSGAAHHFAARHNEVADFNAHFKINGDAGGFPDDGLIEHNTLTNSVPRRTANPVTPIDLVGASRWVVRANVITDFVRADAETTSYGAFAKGAAEGTRFERNIVLCEHRLRGLPGSRVGLSLGGGGSLPYACRDRRCVVEHDDGVIEANLIAFCSDSGIDINRASRSLVRHNTLLDTGGVSVREPAASAELEGNLVDGALYARHGAGLHDEDNQASAAWRLFVGSHPVRALFAEPAALAFEWHADVPRRRAASAVPAELCGSPRPAQPAYGAFEDFRACAAAR